VLYRQVRVGRHGQPFVMPKFRTMTETRVSRSAITVGDDPRVTRFGRALRRTRLDELPQLWCVVRGQMSLVGPRPDVPGYADRLVGRDRELLELRPGITGPATIAFRDEESLLAGVRDPLRYNDEVIYPAKTRLNLAYLEGWSLLGDCRYLLATLHPVFERWLPATRASGDPPA
jgi:lipopolysaccharide/colanic/teichoic acid biosynthesis glycosyltransferase